MSSSVSHSACSSLRVYSLSFHFEADLTLQCWSCDGSFSLCSFWMQGTNGSVPSLSAWQQNETGLLPVCQSDAALKATSFQTNMARSCEAADFDITSSCLSFPLG